MRFISLITASFLLAPAHAEIPNGQAFVAAFGEACSRQALNKIALMTTSLNRLAQPLCATLASPLAVDQFCPSFPVPKKPVKKDAVVRAARNINQNS